MAISVGLWCLWFVTHVPWLGLEEQVSLPLLLTFWLLATAFASAFAVGGRLVPSAMLGLMTSVIGLLLVGTKLVNPPESGIGKASGVVPNSAIIAGGFLVLGGVIGALGGALARFVPAPPPGMDRSERSWLARFSFVCVVAIMPLLFIGGLVTSTNSGMAVPDWPNTFGSNMFLYPLGPRADAGVFLEHSHRLFGTLIGLSTLALMILTILHDPRRWVKVWAIVLFAVICLQGGLGGIRVRMNERWYALLHGVLAQMSLALAVCVAAFLSDPFRNGDGVALARQGRNARRTRLFSTGAMHATLLQLIFGAMYRHLREAKGGSHALMSHMALSIIVVLLVTMAGFAAGALVVEKDDPLARTLKRTGRWVIVAVALQFLLGWLVFFMGGKSLDPGSIGVALLRTAHQANGALLLGLISWMAIVSRRIPKRVEAPAPA